MEQTVKKKQSVQTDFFSPLVYIYLSSLTFWAAQQIFIQSTENEPAAVAIVEIPPSVQLSRISTAG